MGKTGLMTSQLGIEITGNNVANANTEGYSKQSLQLSNAPTLEFNGSMIGQGAVVSGIGREESVFITNQLIDKGGDYGEFSAMNEPLEELERIVAMGENSLADDLDSFFVSWQALSTDPASNVLRQDVIQQADVLADNLNQMTSELDQLQENINLSLESQVDQVNQQLDQVADLNQRIMASEADGSNANGLRDERERVLLELSQTLGIESYENGNGMVSVQLPSGLPLVEGGIASQLSSERQAGKAVLQLDMGGSQVNLATDDVGGEIKGLLTVRDETIEQVASDLDQLAYRLAQAVNEVHEGGVDADGQPGQPFFSVTTATAPGANPWDGAASSLSVAISAPAQVAAGTVPAPDHTSGDNTNTLNMVALQQQELVEGSTLTTFYSLLAADVGLQVEQNDYALTTASDALMQIQNMRDGLVGVSTDEELLLLTQYQSGYEAAAKYLAVVDEMLDTLMTIGA